MKNRHIIIIGLFAFIIGCAVVFLRLSLTEAPSSQPVAEAETERLPIARTTTSGADAKSQTRKSKSGILSHAPDSSDPGQITNPQSAIENPQSKPPPPPADVDFTADDIEDSKTTSIVSMDIGDYDVRYDEEFEVAIRVEAPALANFSLMLNFDPEHVEYVADSVRTVADYFRSGTEFYARNNQGRMILLTSGSPGMKHMNKTNNELVATVRMRALRPGTTEITATPEGTILLNAFGKKMEYALTGGEIRIAE